MLRMEVLVLKNSKILFIKKTIERRFYNWLLNIETMLLSILHVQLSVIVVHPWMNYLIKNFESILDAILEEKEKQRIKKESKFDEIDRSII